MSNLEQVNLAYSSDVNGPGPWETAVWPVKEAIHPAQLMGSIFGQRSAWDQVVASYWGDRHSAFGDCYMNAVVLCSILRHAGYPADSCYVSITCHLGEDFGRATHATTLVQHEGTWFMLDATKRDLFSGCWKLASLRQFFERNRLFCLFNDRVAFLATGDGVADLDRRG